MPTNKDFKRLVRGRMQKTGESYTTARAQLLKKSKRSATALVRPSPRPGDYATLAGMSDAAVQAKTGCTWERWVRALDAAHAADLPHREIAALVHRRYRLTGWWAQTVTVGYERIKGLRVIGQRRSGAFEANKSKTLRAPLSKLYRAFRDARTRAKWLPDVDLTIRTATRDKSMRITWPDKSSVHVYFTAKGAAKSQVVIQHVNLPTMAAAAAVKAHWAERLAELARVLAAPAR